MSIDCLLNVLDGIIETHGRLFFMSANDTTPFDKIKDVLFRPGRVDKQLNITYCSRIQITKIIANFYDVKEDVKVEYLDNSISGENLILDFEEQKISIFANIEYIGTKGKLFADKINIDLITKNVDILMDKPSKNVIVNVKK